MLSSDMKVGGRFMMEKDDEMKKNMFIENTFGGQGRAEGVLSEKLMSDEETSYTESLFESIRHVNGYGEDFWYARELQSALEYKQWRRFLNVIERAKQACENSENIVSEHFANAGKSSPMPNGGVRVIDDYALSRYACYLIVQNSDPRKKVIALGQTYFAVKTRQQELIENYDNLNEDLKRLAIRREMKVHNKSLAEAAQLAGIHHPRDYAIFQNKGYQGLYGGLGRKEIHSRKGLRICLLLRRVFGRLNGSGKILWGINVGGDLV